MHNNPLRVVVASADSVLLIIQSQPGLILVYKSEYFHSGALLSLRS